MMPRYKVVQEVHTRYELEVDASGPAEAGVMLGDMVRSGELAAEVKRTHLAIVNQHVALLEAPGSNRP